MIGSIDKETCIGCGLCPSICPDVFTMDDDGKAAVVTEEIPDMLTSEANEAAEQCPVNAICVE